MKRRIKNQQTTPTCYRITMEVEDRDLVSVGSSSSDDELATTLGPIGLRKKKQKPELSSKKSAKRFKKGKGDGTTRK